MCHSGEQVLFRVHPRKGDQNPLADGTVAFKGENHSFSPCRSSVHKRIASFANVGVLSIVKCRGKLGYGNEKSAGDHC